MKNELRVWRNKWFIVTVIVLEILALGLKAYLIGFWRF
jgi:hypothetical protein